MKKYKWILKNEQETKALGKDLSQVLKPGDIVCLFGDLGAGKTTFVKGLTAGLGINEKKVNSPTFVLMNVHAGKLKKGDSHLKRGQGRIEVFHFDLYRLEQDAQILALGCEEYFYGDGISVIEWADRLGTLLPKEYIGVYFSHLGGNRRGVEVRCSDGRKLKIA